VGPQKLGKGGQLLRYEHSKIRTGTTEKHVRFRHECEIQPQAHPEVTSAGPQSESDQSFISDICDVSGVLILPLESSEER
jgi:hypothetical protein